MSKILVYGGAGALGRCLVSHFKSKGYAVINVDFFENKEADFNALAKEGQTLVQQGQAIDEAVSAALGGAANKLCAIFCVAGGWAGGNAGSEDFLKSSETMLNQSVNSSFIAARLATNHLKPGGLLTMTGALAALEATPGMIGYGVAKAAVHHLVKNLAEPSSGLPEGVKVNAILPVTIDTPMNRKFMPNADHSKWTPPEDIAKQLEGYLTGASHFSNGKLISVVTDNGTTTFLEV
ncbi:hypothetical protein BDF20DRAFT_868649 [Mycotypha africana]|uniref:uncharacterized protein n=1 Tax=Mycotypha africana TaxID=64632 RepID=UPI002300D6C8|nr:uncharacterized protein BDF20DRAFT_868649 [Mycotypha africana]KAI8979282.1 hypothetical protein BDF20DRAFT_868649 [Mycotypha africana]